MQTNKPMQFDRREIYVNRFPVWLM